MSILIVRSTRNNNITDRVKMILNNVQDVTSYVNIDIEMERVLVPINSCQLSMSDMAI